MNRAAAWLLLCAATPLRGQVAVDPRAVLADAEASSGDRCAALSVLQDRGDLDVPTALAALAGDDEDVAATVVAIVRHEWLSLPDEMRRGLDARPVAARRLLRELAIAPRPSFVDWVVHWFERGADRSDDDRCLALAARGTPLAPADADFVWRAIAAGGAGDGPRFAIAFVPTDRVDAWIGRMYELIEREPGAVDALGPLFDRLSTGGVRQLLGLVETLPEASARVVCTRILERSPDLVIERARSMLDGDGPVGGPWLDYAAPLLDDRRRRDRVLAVVADPASDESLRERAFEVLLSAKAVDAPVLHHAVSRPDTLARLLSRAVDRVPGDVLVSWLGDDAAVSAVTAAALVHRQQLGDDVERRLVDILLEREWASGTFFDAIAAALVAHASEAALDRAWPRLRAASAWRPIFDTLGRRREPFVHELLVAELAAKPPEGLSAEAIGERLDAVRLALVAVGDRSQLAELVAGSKGRSATFVSRCAHHARPLPAPLAAIALDGALSVQDPDVAMALLEWAAATDDPAITDRLWRLVDEPAQAIEGEALREVAVRALAAGSGRQRLVERLQKAYAAGPLPDLLESVPFEIVASTPVPLSPADARFLADLTLRPPLSDPELERDQRLRWPDGRFGFRLVAAVAQRLRGGEPDVVREAFRAAVAAVREDPRWIEISRQRLLVLWRSLEVDRELMAVVAEPTAPLLLALPDPDHTGGGPANWFAMNASAAAGDDLAAVKHARAAIAGLLRLPSERSTARLFLGEREPASGRDPWAALSAAPHRFAFCRAVARGDDSAAAATAALVREFAGRDTAALAEIPSTTQDPNR